MWDHLSHARVLKLEKLVSMHIYIYIYIYIYINLDYSLSLQYSVRCVHRAWYIRKLDKSTRHNFFVTLSFTLTLQNLSDDRVSVELRVTEKLCLNGFSVCLFWLVHTVVVSTFVECFLVWRGGLVKGCFVR